MDGWKRVNGWLEEGQWMVGRGLLEGWKRVHIGVCMPVTCTAGYHYSVHLNK